MAKTGGTEGSAGLIGKAELDGGTYDFSASATSSAQGGKISTGTIFNTSTSGGVGFVKMLAFAGFALILYRIYRRK